MYLRKNLNKWESLTETSSDQETAKINKNKSSKPWKYAFWKTRA